MVNSRVVARQRPAWSWFDGPGPGLGVPASARTGGMGVPGGRSRPGFGDVGRPSPVNTGRRTFAALGGDLGGFGLNVPPPQTHAGRLANKAVARLMWARKPVKIRWHSPTGQEPYAWRIYAAPRARQNVLDVLRDVVSEAGQGSVSIRVHQDTREGVYPDEAWYVELLPPELQQAEDGDRSLPAGQQLAGGSGLGMPAAYAWAPKRDRDFGPRQWRAAGRPSVPGYAGDVALGPAATPPVPEAGREPLPPEALGPVGGGRRVVREIVDTLRTRGEQAGLERARRLGPRFVAGVRAWVRVRASTEEQLASEVAHLRARIVRHRGQHPGGCATCEGDEVVLYFLLERLAEVRDAKRHGHTPAQAVADRPEVPRTSVPRWVPFTMLALAVLSAVSAVGAASTATARREAA